MREAISDYRRSRALARDFVERWFPIGREIEVRVARVWPATIDVKTERIAIHAHSIEPDQIAIRFTSGNVRVIGVEQLFEDHVLSDF